MELAYIRGRAARNSWKASLPWRHLNPHAKRSSEADAWDDGWADADKELSLRTEVAGA